MKVYEIEINGSSQWVAAENIKQAFDLLQDITGFDDPNDDTETLLFEVVPESDWGTEWIADEDDFGNHYSIRQALIRLSESDFPCLIAAEE